MERDTGVASVYDLRRATRQNIFSKMGMKVRFTGTVAEIASSISDYRSAVYMCFPLETEIVCAFD